MAWELSHATSAGSALFVCHRCDNPSCCNPAHLFLGTNADNMADMARKGRSKPQRGSRGHNAKLDEATVASIRESVAMGVPQSRIAEAFGMSRGSVSDIVNGKTWTHVPAPLGRRSLREVRS